MLASQLCAFDDKTDSDSKWVKKFIMIILSRLSSLYCQDFDLCRNLMTMRCKVNVWSRLKELEQLKLSPSTKCAAVKFTTKEHKKKSRMLKSLWQRKNK